MKSSEIELSSIAKTFEYEKLSRDIDKVDDMDGSSWEVLHIQEHWTPTTVALDQDLKLIQAGACKAAAAVV